MSGGASPLYVLARSPGLPDEAFPGLDALVARVRALVHPARPDVRPASLARGRGPTGRRPAGACAAVRKGGPTGELVAYAFLPADLPAERLLLALAVGAQTRSEAA